MMHDMAQWGGHRGTMMWGMGIWWLLVLVLATFGVAALAKYLFTGRR
jgi:hypothetical protein